MSSRVLSVSRLAMLGAATDLWKAFGPPKREGSGCINKFAGSIAALMLYAAVVSCGKVSDLGAPAPAFSSVSITSSQLYGIRVGKVATGVSTNGGIPPLVFAIDGGRLPEGLKLSEDTGAITGEIPPSSGNKDYAVTILVTDSDGMAVRREFSGIVEAGSSLLSINSDVPLADFIAGVQYQYPTQVSGGQPPYTFKVASGKLPSGITLDPATGVLGGKPVITETEKPFAFGLQVDDSSGQSAKTDTLAGIVKQNPVGPVKIVNDSLAGVRCGNVDTGIAISGGFSPYVFASEGDLPAGLTLNKETGAIGGTIPVSAANTAYAFSIKVKDASGTEATQMYAGTVAGGAANLDLVSTALGAFTAGIPYSYPITVVGGYGDNVFSIADGSMPSGITLDAASGLLSGTPAITSGGQSYNFRIKVADSSGQIVTGQFFGTIAPNPAAQVKIISASLPGLAVGPVSTGVSTSGGVAPLTFSVDSGALPSGVTLNKATGVISGTIPVPSANSGFAVAIKVVDTTGSTDIKTFTGTVSAGTSVMNLVTTTLASFAAGIPYSSGFVVTGGVTPYNFVISSGSMPDGITLGSTTGILSGTPVATSGGAPYSFTLVVTDSAGQTQSRPFSGSVVTNPAASISIISENIAGLAVGTVSTGISTAGGISPLTFSIASGALPTGLSMNAATGVITGSIPVSSANASYAVAIKVDESGGTSATKSFTGSVSAGNSVLTMNSTSIQTPTAGIPYNYPLVVTGGTSPYSFSVTSGVLPTGLTLGSTTGVISGTPGVATGGQNYSFTVTVTDGSSQTQSRSFVGTVSSNPAAAITIVSTALSGMSVGTVSSGIAVLGGIPPVTFSIPGGALPTGLSLNSSTGAITGTIPVSAAGTTYAVSILVTDTSGSTAQKTFSGSVSAGDSALVFNSTTISSITAGIAYSCPLVASAGVTPYTFSLASGTMPSGLTLGASTGVISGTPSVSTSGQSYGFTVTVTDAAGQSKSRTFVGSVGTSAAASLAITTTSITAPTAGSPYVQGIGLSGGTYPYNFSITSGSLPAGLNINSATGVISGTPTLGSKGSSYLFTVTATDANGLTAASGYNGIVGTYATTMLPAGMPNGTPSVPYNVYVTTINGAGPYTYTLLTGSMPSGLSLNSTTGLISGVIAAAEAGQSKSFTIKSLDANGVAATNAYTLVVDSFAVSVTTSSLTAAVEGVYYNNSSINLGASGGSGPYTFSYTGALPSGVALSSSGVFFGTPAVGTGALSGGSAYSIAVRATDANGVVSNSVSLTLTVTISVPTIASASPTNAVLGSLYSHTFAASGGRAPYTFSVFSGSLPSGLTMASTGVVSGTPTAATTCPSGNFVLLAMDSLGQLSATSTKCIVAASGVAVSNNFFPTIIIGQSYSATVTAIGGTPPYTFGATALPTGISITPSTGALTGFTNASAGYITAFLTVSDSSVPPINSTRSYTFNVRSPLTLAGAALPRGATGIPYNATTLPYSTAGYQLSAIGGQTPYTYAMYSGSMPAGLSLSSSGLITGSPAYSTAANGGNFTFAVTVSDSSGQVSAPATFTMTISTAPKLVGSTIPAAVQGQAFAYDLRRLGGYNDFSGSSTATQLSYDITGLSAVGGLNFGPATGRIYGTPTTAGTYTIGVTLTDGLGFQTAKNFSFTVRSSAKVLELKSARYSDPCLGSGQCSPSAWDVTTMTSNSVAASTQQFAVYYRGDIKAIQFAKIDGTGRIPRADQNSFSTKILLPAWVSGIQYLRAVDIDQDSKRDIVFTDYSGHQVCVLWNSGSVDAFGMPNGFSTANLDCFPIPLPWSYANGTNAGPLHMRVTNMLRPDATNNGRPDIIVGSSISNNSRQTFTTLLNTCPVGGNCTNSTTQRPLIFKGYSLATTATTTSGSTSATVPFMVFPGMPLSGPNLAAGTYVTSAICTAPPCSVTLSANALTSGSGNSRIIYPTVTNLTGASITNTSNVITTSNTGSVFLGQSIVTNSTALYPTGVNQDIRYPTITAIVANTSVTVSSAATGTGAITALAFGPPTVSPVITVLQPYYSNNPWGASQMRDANNSAVGWFRSVKPSIPAGVTSSLACPGIAFGGFSSNNTAYAVVYVVYQTYSGGECLGDFQTHTPSSDEWAVANNSPWLTDVLGEDFNGDGITDIAVTTSTPQTASASVRISLGNGASGTTFNGSTTYLYPQLQSRGTATVGAQQLATICLDGSASCSYPSLTVATSQNGISILPNSCTSPGCTSPFEANTPTQRIDYSGPGTAWNSPFNTSQYNKLLYAPVVAPSYVTYASATAVGNEITVPSTAGVSVGQTITGINIPGFTYVTGKTATTITLSQNVQASPVTNVAIPKVGTQSDLVMMGIDQTQNSSAPYFLAYQRNGTSATDPLKSSAMLDSFPASYLQTAEIGTMRVADANSDGMPDLFTFAPNQGFVASYMSYASGGVNYDLISGPAPFYLANPSTNGCPSEASACFPDPIFNGMGVQQLFPQGSNIYNENTMDLADVNNDGISDIVANGYSSRGVAVALGQSSGEFRLPVLYDAGSGSDLRPQTLTFADLDQDGALDLVMAGVNTSGGNTGFASWLKGNGDGTFQMAQRIDQILTIGVTSCSDPRQISAVDIDLDGRPELAVLCYTLTGVGSVFVSRRNNSGQWISMSSNVTFPSTSYGVSMAWGRLTTASATGVDLAIVYMDGSSSLRIYNNIGLTLTSSPTSLGGFQMSIGSSNAFKQLWGVPASVTMGDLDGDGTGDLVIPMFRSSTNNVTTNGWASSIFYTCTSSTSNPGNCTEKGWGMDGYIPSSAALADLNNDGLPEIFLGYGSAVTKKLYRNISRIMNTSY